MTHAPKAALAAVAMATAATGQVSVPGDYATIQSAIAASSSGTTIHVSPGVYTENINYLGKDLIVISTDGASVTTIDGQDQDTTVTFENNEGTDARLEGFTITNGRGPIGSFPGRGGGIHCHSGTSPTIVACVIVDNTGSADAPGQNRSGGGGIHCEAAAPSIIGCLIEMNTGGSADLLTGSGAGAGGIHCHSGGFTTVGPYIADCTIRNNTGGSAADAGGHDAGAGGVWVKNSPATIVTSTIEGNKGGDCGAGGNDSAGAGGIHLSASASLIDKCIIRNNCGGTDGASSGKGGGGGVHMHLDSAPVISNCLIYGNVGGQAGLDPSDKSGAGGVHCSGNNGADPVLVNCTVTGNVGAVGTTGGAGGVSSHVSTRLLALNCIIWGNAGAGGAPDNVGTWGGTAPRVRHSLIGGGYIGEGNFSGNPTFVDAGREDYRLLCQSPCVDAGSQTDGFGASAPDDDLDGQSRDDGAIDIGAYEYRLGDLNYCIAATNSTGQGAHMRVAGSTSISANDFGLRADCVPNTPGIFFYGPNQIQVTFGDGFRCVGGAVRRLPPTTATQNTLSRNLNLQSTSITGGSTWHFQAWYRDPAAGAAGFNTSDAISVDFVQ